MENIRLQVAILGAILLVVAGSCHRDPASSVKPTVTNERDNFHFRLSDVKNHDTFLAYYWQMEGTSANIDQVASIQGGTVNIIVRDGSPHPRIEMYQTDMKTNGAFQTDIGQSGSWQIVITMSNFSGLVDFRLQRR